MPVSLSLKYFLSQLSCAEHVPRPEGEEWKALIDRISVPGTAAAIDEETFFYFLEVLPPKFQGGNVFAFAEGAEPLRLFWSTGNPLGPAGDAQFFCRQLTWNEAKQFCRLANITFPYW